MLEISQEQAQQFIIEKQLLRSKNKTENIIDVVRRIHNIQIDTISVVARSHDLTIFNRLPKYQEQDVWKAIEEKKLFEFWSHGICLLPFEEFPFYRWKIDYNKQNPESYWKKWMVENKTFIEEIYKHVKKNGPTSSSDFKRESKVIGWWDWKKEKLALEYLFSIGRVMIDFRKGFRRYYNLTENVLPASISSESLPKENLATHLVEVVFSSLGLASSEELKTYLGKAYVNILWNNNKKKTEEFLKECVENETLTEIKIENVQQPHYILSKKLKELEKINFHENDNQPMKFLSPFDNLVRERDYPSRFWNFEYKIECYVPVAQRIYGYFSLPILDGHQLIGRTDLKVHRKEGVLEIKSLHFESGIKLEEVLLQRFKDGLQNFADFHNCHKFSFESIQPLKHKGKIKTLFS